MTFKARDDGRFTVEGELSFASACGLWEQSRRLFADVAGPIDIDLGAAGRADSAGLALLVAWTRWANEHNRPIRFVNAPTQIMRLAEVNKLTRLLTLPAA